MARALADRGTRVVLAGVDTDFRGEPFGPMGDLLAIAERVDKLQAICVVCGELATRNQRLVDGKPAPYSAPTIMVGGTESYEARCRRCHQVPRGSGRKDSGPGCRSSEASFACRLTSGSPATLPPANPPSPSCSAAGAPPSSTPTVLAREAQRAGTPVFAAIVERFGPEVVRRDGELDRAALRARVMGEPAELAALNAIVHPAVRRRAAALIDDARRAGAAIVVSDIPLLFETDDPGRFDAVVLVDAPPAVRRERLMRDRGLSAAEADGMMAAQMPAADKRPRSTYVIDNDTDLALSSERARAGVGRTASRESTRIRREFNPDRTRTTSRGLCRCTRVRSR